MSGGAVLLVVDDDDAVRDGTCFLLGLYGYEVHDFGSGAAFLEAASDYPNACVLLDLNMPDMDGIEVLRTLRSHGHHHPVIFLTGHGQDEIASSLPGSSVAAVLSKPCTDEQLVAAIEQALRR